MTEKLLKLFDNFSLFARQKIMQIYIHIFENKSERKLKTKYSDEY